MSATAVNPATPATNTTPRKHKHEPPNVTFARWAETRSHGWRLLFACPSSRAGHPDHELWMSEDGAEARCSCLGHQTHGHCTLTEHAYDIVANYYRDRTTWMSDGVLETHDRKYATKAGAGMLTTGDRARWTAIGDELAARYAAAAA